MANTHSPDPPDARTDTETALVIGGTGKTGRRVTARLRERNVAVRSGTRSAHPPFDWHDESTWEPSLRGVTSAYLTYHPDVGFPDAAEKVGAFADLALGHGVRRLVLLSGRGSEGALRAERALRDSGADWTIVRSSWFAQNFDEGFLTDLVRGGVIAFPAGDVARALGRQPTDFADYANAVASTGVWNPRTPS